MARIMGDAVQAQQSKLNLGMARIAMDLGWGWTECFGQKLDVFLDGIQEIVIPIMKVVNTGGFNEVAGIIS